MLNIKYIIKLKSNICFTKVFDVGKSQDSIQRSPLLRGHFGCPPQVTAQYKFDFLYKHVYTFKVQTANEKKLNLTPDLLVHCCYPES